MGSINTENVFVLTGSRSGDFFVIVGFRSDGPVSTRSSTPPYQLSSESVHPSVTTRCPSFSRYFDLGENL